MLFKEELRPEGRENILREEYKVLGEWTNLFRR